MSFELRRFIDRFVELKESCVQNVFERKFGRSDAPGITGLSERVWKKK